MTFVTNLDQHAGQHEPVMLQEMLVALAPKNHEIYVDGTFGAGGYSQAILKVAPQAKIIAFDRDPEARARYEAFPPTIRDQIIFVDRAFSQIRVELIRLGYPQVNGIVLDLGVSSPQLDQPERGFSFRFDGPLDMRMDPRQGESAADVINRYDEEDLADIIYQYGEERQSRSVARAIVAARQIKPITTTGELASIVRRTIRKSPKDSSDPCTRTFQGLRIFVNQELDELAIALKDGVHALKEGGRFVVVSFHSLEDRLVKQFFQEQSGRTPRPSRYAPDLATGPAALYLPSVKPQGPASDETERNPRSRSAHLRLAIRQSSSIDVENLS